MSMIYYKNGDGKLYAYTEGQVVQGRIAPGLVPLSSGEVEVLKQEQSERELLGQYNQIWNSVKAKRVELSEAPIEFNGRQFDVSENSMIAMRDARETNLEEFPWVDANNEETTITRAQLSEAIQAVALRRTTLVLKSQEIRSRLKAATTLDELNAVDVTFTTD